MTLILGRYQPLDAVRPGGPLRARDLQTAQTVLLREVPLPPDEGAALARMHAARGICHPSLVTLFDVRPLDDGRVLLAYEFTPSQTIAHMSGGQPLHPRRAASLVVEIADAVAELHAHDVTHGAISLATVLVTLKGKAKLDRVGDPSAVWPPGGPEDDLVALGNLLSALAGRRDPGGSGAVGAHAIDTLVARARAGKFESAATFAALLRRAAESWGQSL